MALFGTNGIRGIPNKDHYPDFYLHIAIAVGNVIHDKDFAIASDGRKAVAMLRGAVISGLTSTGHNVIDLGVLPVPALQYYCKMKKVPGIMITASHNPPEYNGIKVIENDGMEASPETAGRIESLYYSTKYRERGEAGDANYAKWNEVGDLKADSSAKELYIKGILEKVDVEAIKSKGLTVLYDCSNGSTYETTPMLLKELGIKGIALNSTLDSMFPGHNPEPTEENIKSTIEVARTYGVDFAVVHDSDGDRSIFISPEGKYLDGNYSITMIAMGKLKKGDAVVTPVNTSDILIEVLKNMGVKVYITKVGAPVVARKAAEVNAKIAGEENGGIIFPEHQICRDGAMSLALFAEAVAKKGLKNLLGLLPDLYYKRDKVNTGKKFDDIKNAVLKKKHISEDFTDGVKIYLNKTDWIMLRPSGTEPVVRLYVQASSKKRGEEILDEYKKLATEVA